MFVYIDVFLHLIGKVLTTALHTNLKNLIVTECFSFTTIAEHIRMLYNIY